MSIARFVNLCQLAFKESGFSEDTRYKKRYRWETEEIIAKEKYNYFIDYNWY